MRVVPVLLVLAALVTGCGGADDEPQASASGCESVEAPEPRDAETLEPPALYLTSSCELEFLPTDVARAKVLRLGHVSRLVKDRLG